MSTEQGHLYKPTWYSKILAGPIKDGLISSPPEKWKIHRSAISKVFTCSCLLRQLNTFEEHAKRFVLKLQETCNSMPCSNKPVMSFENQVDMLIFEIILRKFNSNAFYGHFFSISTINYLPNYVIQILQRARKSIMQAKKTKRDFITTYKSNWSHKYFI